MPENFFGGDRRKMLTFAKRQVRDPEAFGADASFASAEPTAETIHFKDGRVYERYSWPLDGGTVFCFRDVSERESTQKELVWFERLCALGELSAGISHNLNNILTGILGPTQVLETTVRTDYVHRQLDILLLASRRARDLVQRLHLYARGLKDEEIRPVDLNAIVEKPSSRHSPVGATSPRLRDARAAR